MNHDGRALVGEGRGFAFMKRRVDLLVVHSSNELYGADRMLLQVVDSSRRPGAAHRLRSASVGRLAARNGFGRRSLSYRGVQVLRRRLPILRRSSLGVRAWPGLLSQVLTLVVLLLRTRPRIVYLTTTACLLCSPIARLLGARSVLLHVQEVWRPVERRPLGLLAKTCTKTIAISQAGGDALPASVQRSCVVVHNGVPDARLRVPPADGQHQGPGPIVIASRWNVCKGHHTLLKAWADVGDRARLTILAGPRRLGRAWTCTPWWPRCPTVRRWQ